MVYMPGGMSLAGTASTANGKKPVELYRTNVGKAVVTLAEDYLPHIEEGSVDLVVTSPPFALLREKAYGNREQGEYVDWLVSFGPLVRRVLKDTGSFVVTVQSPFGTKCALRRSGKIGILGYLTNCFM
jgi:DNA methylase